MKGDYSRPPFPTSPRYAGVLLQQGRVLLDADWNEQAVGSLELLRAVAADLVGWHGTPRPGADSAGANGFAIRVRRSRVVVGSGHYYVDGILCDNPAETTLPAQPFATGADDKGGSGRLLYLDVWERAVSHVEEPSIREVALGGPDTTTRLQTVWQVKSVAAADGGAEAVASKAGLLAVLRAADAGVRVGEEEPGLTRTGNYAGLESRLYRVEIHDGGTTEATFKWSRDNGSVAARIERCVDDTVVVDSVAAAARFAPGDHVEVETRSALLAERPGPAADVVEVAGAVVTLSEPVACDGGDPAVLRRWDGAVRPLSPGRPHDLGDGVHVTFGDGSFRSGDYWMFTARPGAGVVDWPPGEQRGRFGVEHHYAPLALVRGDGEVVDLRRTFLPLGGPG